MIDEERHMVYLIECKDKWGNTIPYSIGADSKETALEILKDAIPADQYFDRIRDVMSSREYSKDKVK